MLPRELLKTGSEQLGVDLTSEQINSMFIYVAELKKWNRKINLTAIVEEREIVIKHLLDSLSYLKGFDPFPGLRLLDMGSGAGFPAIPIKINQSGLAMTLVESVKKKASFLRHIVRTLNLTEIDILDIRLEEVADSSFGKYDVVTARAYADMPQALQAGGHFLKTNGLMVLSRGPEETISEDDLIKLGVTLERKLDLVLPHSDYRRGLWIFKKVG